MHKDVRILRERVGTQETTEEGGQERKLSGLFISYSWSIRASDIHTHGRLMIMVASVDRTGSLASTATELWVDLAVRFAVKL